MDKEYKDYSQGGTIQDTTIVLMQPAPTDPDAADRVYVWYSWASIKSALASVFLPKNAPITAATKTKITYDANGLVTGGTDATQDDIIDGTTYKQYSQTEKTKLAKYPSTATNGKILQGNGSNYVEVDPPSGGSGDVVGPASATDNALARFDATTGKLIQNSAAILDDSGNLTTPDVTVSSVTALTPSFFDGTKKLISATGALLGAFWHTLTSKSTPIDADEITVLDSASSFEAKRTTLTQFKAFLKTYFDGVSVITITTGASSITTATTDGDGTTGVPQNARTVIIDNSTNAINFTLNGSVTASYIKHGTGTITILRGSGREMYVNGSNVASALFNGLVGSTMSIIQVGARDYVNINNI